LTSSGTLAFSQGENAPAVKVPASADAFAKRSDEQRRKFVERFGGNDQSEQAINSALKWLSLQQQPDGGWDFQLKDTPSRAQPGYMQDARNGATALALLPFLGAGHTHRQGDHQACVQNGLRYLLANMKVEGKQGKLADRGTMYTQALGALALCEAYALTKDRDLLAPAQAALNYIVEAQDPAGGGWRYTPRQPGDTSVTAWQLQALFAGKCAGLEVPENTFEKIAAFLDAKSSKRGARYGYVNAVPKPSTTAFGLYSRTLLGWTPDHPPLREGISYLTEHEPVMKVLCANYFISLLLRHHTPKAWNAWNEKLRDDLVAIQDTEGAEAGSWWIEGEIGAKPGGRLYCTALAALILESYYRSAARPFSLPE
jgi:hypothetical protein